MLYEVITNLIAEKWKLGEEISDTITYHHTPETYQGVQNDILFTVILSDHFANILEIGFSGNRYVITSYSIHYTKLYDKVCVFVQYSGRSVRVG